MDWSRAKNILILIFIALNIFLAFNLVKVNLGNSVSKETIQKTVVALNKNSVMLECSIPVYGSYTAKLNSTKAGYERKKLISSILGKDALPVNEPADGTEIIKDGERIIFDRNNTFTYTNENPDDSLDILNDMETEKYIRNFIRKFGLPVGNYVVDFINKDIKGSSTYTFIEEYKGFLVFDNRILVTVTGKGITKVEAAYRQVKGFTSYKSKVIPVHLILLKYYNDGSRKVITDIDIGFKGTGSEENMVESSEGPVWRICTKGEKDRYFKAYDVFNGEEIK